MARMALGVCLIMSSGRWKKLIKNIFCETVQAKLKGRVNEMKTIKDCKII